MTLLVIVLCLLSERFLVHVGSHHRFQWFAWYSQAMGKRLSQSAHLSSPWFVLLVAVMPACLVVGPALYFCSNGLFGIVGLCLNILILYVCIGPENPFYPVHELQAEHPTRAEMGSYFAHMNGALFSVIFWYLLLGPLAALLYRLIDMCKNQAAIHAQAAQLLGVLDWLPARITALLYLVVGNFQSGKPVLLHALWLGPNNNNKLLSECGLHALGVTSQDTLVMTDAENLVEHAVIAFLFLLACLTLAAWM